MRTLTLLIILGLVGCTDETKDSNYTLGIGGGGDNGAAGDQASGDSLTGDTLAGDPTTAGDASAGDALPLGDAAGGDTTLPGDGYPPGDSAAPGDVDLGICGGIAGFVCTGNTQCVYPVGTCLVADNLGSCVPSVSACADVWAPVCGCNGTTYGNSCEAQLAGMSVDYLGECGGTPAICGGIAGIICTGNTHCIYPVGTCLIADNAGSCVPISTMCPGVYAPVCGCDGVTYGNSCEAERAGVSIDHTGVCT